MCVFCAAVPATMALGVSAQSRQNQKRKEAEAAGKEAPKPILPAGRTTALLVAALLTGSVLVHTHWPG